MKRHEFGASLLRDTGVFFFLCVLFALFVLQVVMPAYRQTVYLIYVVAMFTAAAFGFFGRTVICFILSGVISCVFVAFALYGYYADGTLLAPTDYFLVPLPLGMAGSLLLYQKGFASTESENVMLRKQVEELVLVDDLTGLYNLRALYRDMRITEHYCSRNHLPLSLLIVQLRYEQELRRMLSRRSYDLLLQKFAALVTDNVRVEDRTYAIDERGTLALLLTADEKGGELVKRRLLNAVATTREFEGILEAGVYPALRFSCRSYSREKDGEDLVKFKKRVESELEFDV